VPDYLVTYEFHLMKRKKLDDWPNPVVNVAAYPAENMSALRKAIDTQIITFAKQGGVVTLKDTNRPLRDDLATIDLRIWIPMHMVTHITTRTKMMSAGIDEDGGFIN
jgi:hypothetical protein